MRAKRGKAHARPEQHDQVAGFDVHLNNFEGPFDLLLQLIGRHELDVTTVALGGGHELVDKHRVARDLIRVELADPAIGVTRAAAIELLRARDRVGREPRVIGKIG